MADVFWLFIVIAVIASFTCWVTYEMEKEEDAD